MKEQNQWSFLFLAWFISLVATLGSLFFSEIMHYPPCSLCWYQRICMYPLVLIIGVSLAPVDLKAIKYSFPLVGLGLFFAIYHNLIHYGVISESLAPCSMGIPCAVAYINWFGFLTIPLMSLFAFLLIFLILIRLSKQKV